MHAAHSLFQPVQDHIQDSDNVSVQPISALTFFPTAACILRCLAYAAGKPFSFPERHHAAGETMRAAAERVLQESAQPEAALQTYFLGNGPICHWARNDSPLFFHKAQLIRGSLTSAASSTDYAWLSKAEVLAQTCDDVLRDLFDKVL